jgi:molybdopterin molybdotransferase
VLTGNLERVSSLEGESPSQHAEKDDAERVHVARRRGWLTRGLLGRHVGGCSQQRALRGESLRPADARDAEVRDLGAPFFVEEDVAGLQVAVDDSLRVGMGEPRGDLAGDPRRVDIGERLAGGEAVLERSPREVLEDHVRPVVLAAVVEEEADVRVTERGNRVRLALEARRIAALGEQLDDDPPVEHRVLGPPDLGHSAAAQPLEKAIAPTDRVGLHGSRLWAEMSGHEKTLLSFEAAQTLVLERVQPLPVERVPVAEAGGRILAEPAVAAVDLPPFDSSAMDGFAVRAADTPGRLPVVARIAAGRPAPRPLGAGEAMAIATGGVVPDGADAVVPVEVVVEAENRVEIGDAVPVGENVRPAGGDVGAGQVVVPAGIRVGPAQIGALAAAGVAEVGSSRRPRAAVLATGSELRRPGEPLEAGQVYEANGLILAAQLAAVGAEVERLPVVADDEEAHREAIARGLQKDLLLTTGGVSVGPHDLVRSVEADLGVDEVFWGVSIKPGKPISFGVAAGCLVFGLPGNPVSALVGFELFVRPAVLALQGAVEPLPRFERAPLASAVRPNPVRDELIRARIVDSDGGAALEPLSGRESHMIARAAGADALVLVPHGGDELPGGALARYLRL